MTSYTDELNNYISSLSEDITADVKESLIAEKSRELKKKYKKKIAPYKKRKKSRKQKLDSRRNAYVQNLREANPEITDEELENHLEKYSHLEDMLLEMDIEFNKKISDLRIQLMKKYDLSNPEISNKLRDEFIKEEVKQKSEFFKGQLESSAAADVAKERMSSISKQADIKHTMDFMSKISKKEETNQKTESVILETDSTDTLIKKYKLEMIKKYDNPHIMKKMVKNLINIELKNSAPKLRTDIELKYKLKDERKEKEKEWSKRKLYKNNNSLLQSNLDKYIEKRRRTLQGTFNPGSDPDKDDKKAMADAEQIWRDVNRESKSNPGKWNSLSDKNKLEPFTKGVYKNFYEAYPLIVKYMVYKLQYHPKAFRRFLEKCRTNTPNKDAKKRKKGEVMEYWQENQAWYCRFLYEEYRKAKNLPVNMKTAGKIFADSYEMLRKEKSKFESNFDETKKKLDDEIAVNYREKINDIIDKLKNNELHGTAKQSAIDLLRDLVELQNKPLN